MIIWLFILVQRRVCISLRAGGSLTLLFRLWLYPPRMTSLKIALWKTSMLSQWLCRRQRVPHFKQPQQNRLPSKQVLWIMYDFCFHSQAGKLNSGFLFCLKKKKLKNYLNITSAVSCSLDIILCILSKWT